MTEADLGDSHNQQDMESWKTWTTELFPENFHFSTSITWTHRKRERGSKISILINNNKKEEGNTMTFYTGYKRCHLTHGEGDNMKTERRKGQIITREKRRHFDYTNSGRGGSALLINQKLRVSETGVSSFGWAAWATVHAASRSIRVASLHTLKTKEERQTYWEWWDSHIDGEDWILAGDFNNVELSEDSKGKSALMQGSEERDGRRMVNTTDNIDAYMAAVRTKGGLFTRMAFCGQRYDQARLDRFYLSNKGEWCELIEEVIHNTEQTLSNHVPISLELQLIRAENCNWKPMSYFKINQQLMENQEVLMKLKETWEDRPPFCKNSQKRWEMGWGRLRKILKEEKNRQKNDCKEEDDIRREIEDLRIILKEEDNEETSMRLLS
ncbi:hypothetical protein R1sor_014270 [Riccia sorocarpa]|uniref:Endonuclease/exonuclease/phosphatase domain-containing protein n=1 Tax=Riccia sorocarpa TaxID=122646 RepID=A0ABD3HAV5_9MARC